MDDVTHSLIATGAIAVAYYCGRYLSKRSMIEGIIESMLENLEKDGLIAIKKDKDGEKDIIPINEIVAKALRDAK
jgi:hypothetical protein